MGMLAGDFLLTGALLITFILIWPGSWLLPVLGALVAISPDATWFPGYLRNLQGKTAKPLNWFQTFHLKIQWGELPWGMIFEVVWFVGMLLVLAKHPHI
jgi:hypothetical protein